MSHQHLPAPDITDAESPPGEKTSAASKPLHVRGGRLPAASPLLAPRDLRGDVFEQNPLSQVGHQLDAAALALMEDSERVREAVRSLVERGGDLRETAREWKVAPSSLVEWREKYYELLQQESLATTGVPLFEPDLGRKDADLVHIPETARLHFLANWERMVEATTASPLDFYQSPRQVFLENSWLTCWLYEDGTLDKSILSGVITGLVAIVVTASFLMARQGSVPLPELPPPPPVPDVVADIAIEAAQNFFRTDGWEGKLRYVRQPDKVRAEMEKFYLTHPDGPITDAKLSMGMTGINTTSLNFEIPSLNRFHFINVSKTRAGQYLVDWETSSLYQEEHLKNLREEKPTTSTRIAVTVTKADEYYNYEFADSTKWTGYRLTYPGLPMVLYGYAPKDSQVEIDLDATLGVTLKAAVLIDVAYPPDAKADNQVEILKVSEDEWIPDI